MGEGLGQAGAGIPEAVQDEHLHDRIKMVAYELWQQEGQPEGRAMDHWDEATRRVLAEARPGGQAPPLTRDTEVPTTRVEPDPRGEWPGLSSDLGGTPSANVFGDLGRG